MLPFVLRRLGIMVPTLLGISLVTLVLIHLAPGDPVEAQFGGAIAARTISVEEIEALRRTFFLDLPILFNPHPRDRETTAREVLADLTGENDSKRNRAVRRLSALGAVALSEVVAAFPEMGEAGREAVLAGLVPVARRMGLEARLEAAPDPERFWRGVMEAFPSSPEGEARKLVASLVEDPEQPDVVGSLHRLDTFAIPALVEALLAVGPDEASSGVLTRLLDRLAGTGNTIHAGDGAEQRSETVADWRRWWRLHRPDYVVWTGVDRWLALVTETQYGKWLDRLVRLDFDRSSRDHLPIRKKLGQRLNVTLTLAFSSLFFAYLVAIPLGVFSALKQYSVLDRTVTVGLFMLYSLPTFWVAMLLQQYLCGVDPSGFAWFPLLGLGVETLSLEHLGEPGALGRLMWHLVLPVFVLTYRSFAYLSRYQRGAMLEVIRQDFIRTARAKGLPERVVIVRHAMRNSILPIITLLGMQLPFLVGGAVIVESIFQINGMGLETLEAIRTRDINWIMAAVTVTSLVTMAGILLSDLLYAVVDPRIRGSLRGETP